MAHSFPHSKIQPVVGLDVVIDVCNERSIIIYVTEHGIWNAEGSDGGRYIEHATGNIIRSLISERNNSCAIAIGAMSESRSDRNILYDFPFDTCDPFVAPGIM